MSSMALIKYHLFCVIITKNGKDNSGITIVFDGIAIDMMQEPGV